MKLCHYYSVLMMWIVVFTSSSTRATSEEIVHVRRTIIDDDTNYHQQQSQHHQPPRHRDVQSGLVGHISKFQLINANPQNIGQVLLDPLVTGSIISLSNYPLNQKFSVAAIVNTTMGPIKSVRFQFANKTNFRTENSAPYALCGDNGPFYACSELIIGNFTVGATPYSSTSATGVIGIQSSISFSIVNSIPVPMKSPTKLPTKSPSKVPTKFPTKSPTKVPTKSPTKAPVPSPTTVPTKAPTKAPVTSPTNVPLVVPVISPTNVPLVVPVISPTNVPKKAPTNIPTKVPTKIPTKMPTKIPISMPTPEPGWILVQPNSTLVPRHEACFVMVGRKAYLLAGRGRKVVSIYDPITGIWTEGLRPPIEIHHTQCVTVDQKIWIVSSWTGGYPMEQNTPLIYIYDPATNTWSTKAGLPEPRRRGGSASIVVGRRIYVSHGNRGGHETGNHSTTLGWLDYYDIDLDIWVTNLPDAPNPRDHTGGAYVNGKICITGGRDGGSNNNFFDRVILPTDCYDPITNMWSIEANIPQGRAGSSYGTTCDGKLMIAGGESYGRAWKNVDIFDGTTWTTVDDLNIQRHGSGLAVDCICHTIHIASGSIIQGSSSTSETTSVETYYPNGIQVPCLA